MDADAGSTFLVLASGSANGEKSVPPTGKVSPLRQPLLALIPMIIILLRSLLLTVHRGKLLRALTGSQAAPFLPTQTPLLPLLIRLLRAEQQMATTKLLPPVRSQNRMGTAHSFHTQALPRSLRRIDLTPTIRTRILLIILHSWGVRSIYDPCTRTAQSHTRQLLQARD